MTAELDEETTGPVNPLRDPQDRRPEALDVAQVM